MQEDVYYEYSIHSWDIAAGVLIVEEAGGIVLDPFHPPQSVNTGTKIEQNNYDLTCRCLAGNPTVIQKFLQLAQRP